MNVLKHSWNKYEVTITGIAWLNCRSEFSKCGVCEDVGAQTGCEVLELQSRTGNNSDSSV